MDNLEERIRGLPLEPPAGLADRARRAAQEPARDLDARASSWLPTLGVLVAIALVVFLALTVTAHPDPGIFSNISAGLGG